MLIELLLLLVVEGEKVVVITLLVVLLNHLEPVLVVAAEFLALHPVAPLPINLPNHLQRRGTQLGGDDGGGGGDDGGGGGGDGGE